jgi:hypothetical protein
MPPSAPSAQSHCRLHQQQTLSLLSTTAITAATQLMTMTTKSQLLLFVVNGGNCGHH